MDDLTQYGLAGVILFGVYKLARPVVDALVKFLEAQTKAVQDISLPLQKCLEQFAAHEVRDQERHGVIREDLSEIRERLSSRPDHDAE